MCTVTFIPQHKNSFVLTSNRDEAPDRSTHIPQKYTVDGTTLLYPKDALAGGTWIGLSENQRLICLLNGGFTAHERANDYRMSRGVIVTDLLTQNPISEVIANYDFTDIEPFTIIMVTYEDNIRLFELVWDGVKPHFTEKPLQPHIWSSSLLYTPEAKAKREAWFSNFIFNNMKPSAADLLKFHLETGDGDLQNSLVMNRGFVKTKSITQIEKTESKLLMRYKDLQTNQENQIAF